MSWKTFFLIKPGAGRILSSGISSCKLGFCKNQVARSQSKYLSKSLTSSSLEALSRKSHRRQFCLFLGVFSAQAGCFQHLLQSRCHLPRRLYCCLKPKGVRIFVRKIFHKVNKEFFFYRLNFSGLNLFCCALLKSFSVY